MFSSASDEKSVVICIFVSLYVMWDFFLAAVERCLFFFDVQKFHCDALRFVFPKYLSCFGITELPGSINLCLSPNLESFQPYSSNIFISPTSFSFISETPLAQVLGLFTLSHRSLRLSSLFSNIFSLRLDTSYYLPLLTLFSVTSILPLSPSSENLTSYILFLSSKILIWFFSL